MSTKKKFNYVKLIYVIADFIFTAFVVGATFLSHAMWQTIPQEKIIADVIFTVSFSLLMPVVLGSFKCYRILLREFGLVESMWMCLAIGVVDVIGRIGILLLRYFGLISTMTIWSWALVSGFLFLSLPAFRAVGRLFKLFKARKKIDDSIRTLVIGGGDTAKIYIDETRQNSDNKNYVMSILDDDPNKIGKTFGKIPVEGPISDVAEYIKKYHIQEVVICMSRVDRERYHEILKYLNDQPVRIKRMPLLDEMSGPNDIKVTEVNLAELLCREPVHLETSEIKGMLYGKSVLITGAGGSIGSELVRQVFKTHPKTLVLFDIYENGVYDIQQELVRKMRDKGITDINLVTLIGSTYNEFRVESIIKKYRPDYVYHAAAYKHVPLMEDSPAEAIRTNVIGTYNVAKFADKYGVKKMVLVSTDKAVRPTNVMGATKRFAETIIQYFSEKSKNTQYSAVRFGNVLGSNGSVVPLFRKQIEAGGPVTITHKDIIRYFMTIPEAVSLILESSIFAQGGEIFILDMGDPIKITTLAEKMIRQAGFTPYEDIKIIETGLRPGEKLYEELLLDKSRQKATDNAKIFIEPKEETKPIEDEIKEIVKVFGMDNNQDVKELLGKIIETYQLPKATK